MQPQLPLPFPTQLDRLLALPEVLATLAIGRSTLYQKIQLGELPAPVKIGYSSRWRASQIAQVIAGDWHPAE